MNKTPFADWLERKYLEWQMQNGRNSLRAFSRWLGVNHALISQYLNGKQRPGKQTLPLLANKLGYEVYDVLREPRPDAALEKIISIYNAASPEVRKDLLRQVLRAAGFEPED